MEEIMRLVIIATGLIAFILGVDGLTMLRETREMSKAIDIILIVLLLVTLIMDLIVAYNLFI